MKMNRKKIYKKLLYSFVVLSILTFFLVLFHVNKTNIYLIQEEFLLGLTDNLLVHTPHINYTQGESCEFEIQKNTIILRLDDIATVSQGGIEVILPVKRDERMAFDVVWVANAMSETVEISVVIFFY